MTKGYKHAYASPEDENASMEKAKAFTAKLKEQGAKEWAKEAKKKRNETGINKKKCAGSHSVIKGSPILQAHFLCRPNNNRFRILSRIKKGRNRHSYNFRPKHFDSVKFNPTRHFVKEVYRKGEKELEHADPTYGFKTSSSKHTQEERFGMLMEYLREYTFITRQEYPVLLYPMIDFIERNPAPFSPNAFVPIPYAARYNHIDACPMGQLQ